LINEYTHIATDSAGVLWQIKKSIRYPQRMKWHKHANLLESTVHHIQQSKDTIHLYRVKAHAGILGNECADAIAKRFAENPSGHDIHINTNAHPHSSIFRPARVKNPPPACLPDTLNTCQPGPPAERLFIFSNVDVVKAHTAWNNESVTSGEKKNVMLCRTDLNTTKSVPLSATI